MPRPLARALWPVATLTLVFVASPAARGADGGGGAPEHRPHDAGGGPPGAKLGPLPSAGAATERPGSGEAEARYALEPRADGGFFYEAPQFTAVVAPDGTVAFQDRRLVYSAPKSTFTFDLSDEFVRELAHGTLYPHEKANFLAATFLQRTAMAGRWYADQKRAAQADLPHRLDALWADTRYRRRERRRVIFLLWAETNGSTADGRSAAAIIETWIRQRLPRGSADAYSDVELKALSGDPSTQRPFRPYGSPLEMRFPSP
jgi:hypothetical protein